jgi:chorismate-pyruvate lyase
MLRNDTTLLVNDLLVLGNSTTFFLESLRGEQLRVMIESQAETVEWAERVIRRAVKLYFQAPEMPVLYCISVLNVDVLTDREYKGLMEKKLPIGRVFNSLNAAGDIRKDNILVRQESNPALAILLNVRSAMILEKRYDYWVGDRFIGYISEFFNEESLKRV